MCMFIKVLAINQSQNNSFAILSRSKFIFNGLYAYMAGIKGDYNESGESTHDTDKLLSETISYIRKPSAEAGKS